MIDLFFYWSSVTIWLFPMLFVLGGLAFVVIDWLTANASEYRFDLDKHLGVTRFLNKIDDLFMTILIIIGLCETIFVVIIMASGDSVVEDFHFLASATSPVLGWVGAIALSLFGYWFIARKLFKVYYAISDKLSKR